MRLQPAFWMVWVLVAFRACVMLFFGAATLNGDGFNYVESAQLILNTGGLPDARWQPIGLSVVFAPIIWMLGPDVIATDFRAIPYPGYPGLVDNPVADAVYPLHVAMDLAVVVTLVFVARTFLAARADTWLGVAIGAILALQPFSAEMANFLNPDHAAAFATFVGAWLGYTGLARGSVPRMIVGGALLGAAVVLRVDMGPVIAAVGLALAVSAVWSPPSRPKAMARVLALGLATTAPVMGMMAFQYASSGQYFWFNTGSDTRPDTRRSGYFEWARSWIAINRTEMGPFGQGDYGIERGGDWVGFDADRYPSRIFVDPEQKDRLAEILQVWRSEGYTQVVDDGFRALSAERRAARPLSSYVWTPMFRMAHYWVNTYGSRPVEVILGAEPPWRGMLKAAMAPTLVLGIIGAWAAWAHLFAASKRISRPPEVGSIEGFLRICSVIVVARTVFMAIMGLFIHSGLMEPRYIVTAMPAMLALAAFGALIAGQHALAWRARRSSPQSMNEAPS